MPSFQKILAVRPNLQLSLMPKKFSIEILVLSSKKWKLLFFDETKVYDHDQT